MILNNLDSRVAQFPEELVTYGGNGQVLWDLSHGVMESVLAPGHISVLSAGALQLGAVLDRDALPLHDVGRADARHVLRPPHGTLPLDARQPEDDHHQRDGGAQLLLAPGLRPHVRPRGDNVSEGCEKR